MKTPIILSIQAAVIATAFCMITGTLLARFLLYRKKWQAVFDVVCTLPMILPPTVTGFLLLKLFGKHSVVGQWLESINVSVVFSFTGVVIASTVVAFPLMYRTTLGAFLQVDEDILSAARTLGISETRIFFRVLLPNAMEGLVAGTVLTFARALGEFGATIMLAGNIPGRTQTVSIAIYQAMLQGNDALAYRYVAIILTISCVCLTVMNVVAKRGKR